MKLKAAFRWDSKTKQISFFYYDAANFSLRHPIETYDIEDDKKADQVLHKFWHMLSPITEGGEIEFHILNPNVNHQTMANPSELSKHIYRQFTIVCETLPKWNLQNQCRGELKGQPLKDFKATLKAFGLASRADQWHAWSVGVHATNGNVKDIMKRIWSAVTDTSAKTRDGKTRYQEWLQKLK